MEQDATVTMPITDSGKQKDGKGWKIITAIACIVAVCGIGFGVYGMIDANSIKTAKDIEINNLTDQIDNLNTKIDELESKVDTQQNNSSQENQADEKQDNPIVDDENLTPGIENGAFVFKNSGGAIVMQDNEIKDVSYIIACDGNATGKCTAKTSDGKSVWFIFDLNNKEIKSGYSTVDYGL